MRTLIRFYFGLVVLGLSLTVSADDEVITLDSIEITGNREQPKAIFIVPWQPPPTADSLYRPIQGFLDGILDPVEREAFLRELDYYQQLQGQGAVP